jgi:hypothetical protein
MQKHRSRDAQGDICCFEDLPAIRRSSWKEYMQIRITKRNWNPWLGLTSLFLGLLLAGVAARSGLGQTNLGLTASVSNNAFVITITNALTNARYDLFGVLEFRGTGGIPWTVIQTGAPGQQTFSVSMTPALSGFFVVATNDIDGDGIPNWDDANPNNGAISNKLAITILSPTNGATIY